MGAKWVTTDFECDYEYFFLYRMLMSSAIPTDMLRFLFVATPFCSCFVQLTLRAQTGTKHERRCAPHDGSLATVCGDSRELLHCVEITKITDSEVLRTCILKFSIHVSIGNLNVKLNSLLPNCFRKRISQRAPGDYEKFLFVLWR